ncbi:MAG: methyltransferase [Acidimicrobiales bacterium]|nr:methyltransferase [Acidimicrobiales bacterium]
MADGRGTELVTGLRTARSELQQTLRRPRRVLRLFDRSYLRFVLFRLRRGEPKMIDGRRHYGSYEHYVEHQRSKLALLDLSSYDVTFRQALAERAARFDIAWPGSSVLCLAARIGTEVKAFHDLGAFAVGIDLNPGTDNRYVLPGDFHELQFADDSVDVIYCNSLDHALRLDLFIAETRRVLRPGGTALIEALLGVEEGTGDFSRWEVRSWKKVAEIRDEFLAGGFQLRDTVDFDVPWAGRLFRLEVPGPPTA